MGVDYIARKSAKKRKKKERQAVGKDGVAIRERRRKKIRRLCQGVCYKTPELTEEDKKGGWSDGEGNGAPDYDSDIEEAAAAARAASNKAASTSAAAAAAADAKLQKQSAKKAKKEKKQQSQAADKKRKAADDGNAADGEAAADGGGKLSTSIKLLDPATLATNAANAALKKLQLTPEAAAAAEAALGGYPALLRGVMLAERHVEPTPVQEAAWPAALAGRDVCGVAEPGSGKTLAYLLPGLVRLQAEGHSAASSPAGPVMLVLLPTRELAQQVAGQCRRTRAVTGLRTVCVFGGAPKDEQAALLAGGAPPAAAGAPADEAAAAEAGAGAGGKRPHVLVATPGRLLDLADSGHLVLGHVRYVVLDEADKMLGLGFKPQLDRLYDMLQLGGTAAPAAAAAGSGAAAAAAAGSGAAAAAAVGAVEGKKKGAAAKKHKQQQAEAAEAEPAVRPQRPQVLLFSATMPAEVEAAAAQWLRKPERVAVSAGGANAISRTVTQVVHVCAEHKKPEKLLKHLGRIRAQYQQQQAAGAGGRNPPRVLVFANRVKAVRFLAAALAREGYKVAQLHGQRSQGERNQAVSEFRAGKAQVLVATDVAARGLDIRALPYVVNYDFPARIETYVHRVGRTGRLAACGHAYSFFTRNLAPLAPPLLELLQAHGQDVDPNLSALANAWRIAEKKLGAAGAAAAAAAALRRGDGSGAAAGAGSEDPDSGAGAASEEGGEEADDDEGDAVAGGDDEGKLSMAELALGAAEDLMEGLGSRDARAIADILRKKMAKQQQQQQGGSKKPAAGEAEEQQEQRPAKKARPGDTQLVPTTAAQRAAADAAEPGAGRKAPYMAAKSFAGARPGYCFKKGPLGLGYYADEPLHLVKQRKLAAAKAAKAAAGKVVVVTKPATAAAAGKAGVAAAVAGGKAAAADKAAGGAAAAGKKAAGGKAESVWGLPQRNKPIIPVRHEDFLSDSDQAASDGADSDDDDDEEDGGVAPAAKKQPPAKKRFQPDPDSDDELFGSGGRGGGGGGSGSDDDDDDSDDEEGGRGAAKKKHKALPGRLRKKLAKAKAKSGGGGGGGGRGRGRGGSDGGGRGGGGRGRGGRGSSAAGRSGRGGGEGGRGGRGGGRGGGRS